MTTRWIQAFWELFRIVSPTLTGKFQLRPEKEAYIYKCVDYNLGILYRQFRSGLLHQDAVGNADETPLLINLDKGKILGIYRSKEVEWAVIVSGGKV